LFSAGIPIPRALPGADLFGPFGAKSKTAQHQNLRVGLVWHRGTLLRKTAAIATQKTGLRRAMTEYGYHLSFQPLGVRKNFREPVTFSTRSQD
jgi:hypothetical protein